MGNSNLVPVVRPDTNGKLVTRHMRTQPPVAAARNLPRPLVVAGGKTIEAAKGRKTLLGAVSTAIPKSEAFGMKYDYEELAKLARGLPDELTECFHRVHSGISDSFEQIGLCTLVIKAIDHDATELDIENAIHYFEHSDSDRRDRIDEYFEVASRVRGLPDYPIGNLIKAARAYELDGFSFDSERSFGKQDTHTQEQCAALRELHYAAEDIDTRLEQRSVFAEDGTMKDSRLAQLVVDRPEVIQDVIEVMEDRLTLDYNFIISVIDSDATALREGSL